MRITGPQATDVGVDLGFGFSEAVFTITGDPGSIESSADRYGDYAAAAAEIGPTLAATTVDSWTGDEGEMFRARVRDYVPLMTTAWRVYSDIARHLSVFARTMEQQQSAMRALREEAWQVWQRLQAARAAQAVAAADHAAAASAAATTPLSLAPTTDLVRTRGALEDADIRVRHLQEQWDDCVRRAREIHARMTEAADTAAGTLRTLPNPTAVPHPAPGGAVGTDMPGAVTGSRGVPLPGAAPTALPSPPSVGPAPAGPSDGSRSVPALTARGFADKMTSRREWLKALNLLPSDKLVDYFHAGRTDTWASTGLGLQQWGFMTQYLPVLTIRNDLVNAAKGKANALPRGLVWDRVFPRRWFEADARWQKELLGRYARAGESTLAKAAGVVGRGAGLVSAAERLAQTTTQAAARRTAPLALALALRGPLAEKGPTVTGLLEVGSGHVRTTLRAPLVGQTQSTRSVRALVSAYTTVQKAAPALQRVGDRLRTASSTLRDWAKGVAATPSTLAGKQVNVLDKLGKVGGRLNVAAGVATGVLEQLKMDSNAGMDMWTKGGRAATRGALVGGGGWLGGAAVGAAAGSVVPVVGTAVGGIIGGALGAMAGDAAADAILQPAS